MMSFLKRLIFYSVAILGLWATFVVFIQDKYTVPILMYHQIGTTRDEDDLNVVSLKAFERHMEYLKKNGYHVITLGHLVQGIHQGLEFKHNSVVITFDDGYEDNYSNAFPILKKFGFPATIFVVSNFVGQPGFLTWGQLIEMHNHSITIASHTRNHRYLPDIKNNKELIDEIYQSKKNLEVGLKAEVEFFSYPSGGYSEEIKEIVRQANYKGACATNRGYDRFNTGAFELKRIRVNDKDNVLALWAKLSGFYNLFRDYKNTY